MTPYRDREQIASGALTFAIAAGCAVVSTPYWYAEDMLVVRRRHDRAVRRSRSPRRRGVRLHRAAGACWRPHAPRRGGSAPSSPGRRSRAATAAVLGEAVELAPPALRARRSSCTASRSAPTTCTRWSTTSGSSSTPTASFPTARRATASTTSRGSPSSRSSSPAGSDEQAWTSVAPPLARVPVRRDRPDGAGMRNFMGYDRRWLDEPHVGDHVGRSIWALGEILSTAWAPAVVGPTRAAARLRSSTRSTARSSLRTARLRGLGLARLDPDRLEPGGPRAARARASTSCWRAYRAHASDGLALVRGPPHLRQRPPAARADRRRRRARPRGRGRRRAGRRCAGSATSRASPTGRCG